jgi:hypothetical protein
MAPAPVPAGDEVMLAAVNSDGRLLTFPVADLPELPRGKGNKIFGIPSKRRRPARKAYSRSPRSRPVSRCAS